MVDGMTPTSVTRILEIDAVEPTDTAVERGSGNVFADLGLSQPDVSRLLRSDFREYSLERLLRLLTTLGRDIDIVIRQPRSTSGGKLRIAAEPV